MYSPSVKAERKMKLDDFIKNLRGDTGTSCQLFLSFTWEGKVGRMGVWWGGRREGTSAPRKLTCDAFIVCQAWMFRGHVLILLKQSFVHSLILALNVD